MDDPEISELGWNTTQVTDMYLPMKLKYGVHTSASDLGIPKKDCCSATYSTTRRAIRNQGWQPGLAHGRSHMVGQL
jgi:hypothetical protein